MNRAFAPAPLADLPIRRMSPQAVLRRSPEDLAASLGLALDEGVDGSEPYVAAGLTVGKERVVLLRHHGLPEGVTQVYLTDRRSPDTARDHARLDVVIAALGLGDEPLAWRRGDPLTA